MKHFFHFDSFFFCLFVFLGEGGGGGGGGDAIITKRDRKGKNTKIFHFSSYQKKYTLNLLYIEPSNDLQTHFIASLIAFLLFVSTVT